MVRSRTIKLILALLVINILLAVFVSCAPPPVSDINKQVVVGSIGTPNSYYRTEGLNVADGVTVLKFVDPANKTTCYLGIQSISCVK